MRSACFSLLLILLILTGCKKDKTPDNVSTGTTLTLNKTSLILYLGDADTLQVVGQQPAASITWTTSNDSVVTVTGGKILAVGKGTATITAKAVGDSKIASCIISVSDMSNVIGFGSEYILLNHTTEQMDVGIGNTSDYDLVINRVALYSTKNELISDRTLTGSSIITVPAHTSTITKTYFIGTGNLKIFEPGDTGGVVSWKSIIYFDYNLKHYKVTVVEGHNTFTVQ